MNIEKFKDEQKEAVISLLTQGKDSQYVGIKSKIWDWLHIKNPFVGSLSKGITVNEGVEVVGFNGLMPVDIIYNNKPIKAVWSFDTIMSPTCRGKGYGGKLVDAVKVSAPIVLGLGISDTASHLLIKHNYKVNTDIEQYFYSNTYNGIRDLFKQVVQHLKTIRAMVGMLNKTGVEISIMSAMQPPKEIDQLWHKVESEYSKVVKRSYAYIEWKYGLHPTNKYQLIVIRDNKDIRAVGVFRQHKKMSRLVDYVGPVDDINVKKLIIGAFKKQCKSSELLECTCTDSGFKNALDICGFRKYKEGRPRFYVYSNIENDRNPHEEWFIMGGDSDSDLIYWE